MPETFGDKTPNALWVKTTAHQITEQFTVKAGATVNKGEPLKLHTDGTVLPFVTGDDESIRIGTSLHKAAAGEKCTVILNGRTIILGQADGDTVAGPVKYTTFDTVTKRPKYSDLSVTPAITSGWALDNVLDTAEMRVLIRH